MCMFSNKLEEIKNIPSRQGEYVPFDEQGLKQGWDRNHRTEKES